jgi:hypothetical protein
MSSSIITLIIIVAVVIYMIVRQFQEQTIKPRSLLILPLLITYYTYTSIVEQLTTPLVNASMLIVAMIVGLCAGGLLGTFRGRLARMRFDVATGLVKSKASTLNIVLYLLILVVRIGADTLLALHMNHASVLLALTIAFLTTLFLGNILAEKATLYLRSQRFQTSGLETPGHSDASPLEIWWCR